MAVYHMLIIGLVGPGDNESYYWTWSKHLDWSYFDHPPAVAWMIALTTAVGGDSTFFLRFGTVVLSTLSCFFIYFLALEITGSRRTAFFSLLLANLVPLFFLAGILAVPDCPLILFWTIYLLLLYRVIRGVCLRHWLLLGAVLGAALLSKYFAVLLVPTTLLFLGSDFRLRRHLKTAGPYLAFVISGIVASPVLFWNVKEGWASFTFQLSSRHEEGFLWRNIWNLFAGQMGAVTPVLWIVLLATLFFLVKRGFKPGGDVRDKFIVLTSAPTLFFFYAALCLTAEGEPHWPGLGYLPLLIGAVWLYGGSGHNREDHRVAAANKEGMAGRPRRGGRMGPKAVRIFAALSLALPALIILALNIQLLYPVYRPAFTGIDPAGELTGWEVARHDPTGDLFGWKTVARRVKEVAEEMSAADPPLFVFSNHYNPASQLSFALKDAKNVYCLSEGTDQFDFWQDIDDIVGWNAIYVTTNRYFLTPDGRFIFDSIDGPELVETFRSGKYKVRETYIYRCYNFKGMPEKERTDDEH